MTKMKTELKQQIQELRANGETWKAIQKILADQGVKNLKTGKPYSLEGLHYIANAGRGKTRKKSVSSGADLAVRANQISDTAIIMLREENRRLKFALADMYMRHTGNGA